MIEQKIQREQENKRFCVEVVRSYGETDISKLIKEATALYNFIK